MSEKLAQLLVPPGSRRSSVVVLPPPSAIVVACAVVSVRKPRSKPVASVVPLAYVAATCTCSSATVVPKAGIVAFPAVSEKHGAFDGETAGLYGFVVPVTVPRHVPAVRLVAVDESSFVPGLQVV